MIPEIDPIMGWLVGVLVLIALAYVVWEKGWLGTATEARLKAMRAKAALYVEHLDARIEAKAKAAQQAWMDSGRDVSALAPPKDKATRIAENKALLDAGQVTQSEYDAAKAKILTE